MRWLLPAMLVACTEIEGDDAFECEDGADNDQDGAFDCDDPGCAGSPACGGVDPDTDTGGSSTDPDAVAAHLRSVRLTYTQAHDIGAGDPSVDQLACESYGLCDCVITWEGTGTFVSASGDRVTLLGTFTRTNDEAEGACTESFRGGTWTPEDGVAYHSFRFAGGLATLDQWTTHANEADVDPLLSPSLVDNEQFAIWDMGADFDPITETATHAEVSTGIIELFTDETTHTLDVAFNVP